MNTLKILCLMMFLLFSSSCLTFGFPFLHEDGIGDDRYSLDAFSTRKRIEGNGMIRGRKLMIGDQSGVKSENVEEFGKKMTKMMNSPKTESRASVGGHEVDEDGLVAYTADYWKARHHPPKNN